MALEREICLTNDKIQETRKGPDEKVTVEYE